MPHSELGFCILIEQLGTKRFYSTDHTSRITIFRTEVEAMRILNRDFPVEKLKATIVRIAPVKIEEIADV